MDIYSRWQIVITDVKPSSPYYLISCKNPFFVERRAEMKNLVTNAGFVLGTNNCFSFAILTFETTTSGGSFPRGHGGPSGEALLQPSCLDWPTFFSIFEFPHPSNPSNQLSCHSSVLQVKRDTDKGIVHPKMKILSLITHPHIVPNL